MTSSEPCNKTELLLNKIEVSGKDVTTLRSAFSECNGAMLVDPLMYKEAKWSFKPSALSGKARLSLIKKIDATLNLFNSVKLLSESMSEAIIIPWQHFHVMSDVNKIERIVEAALFKPSKMYTAMNLIEEIGAASVCSVDLPDSAICADYQRVIDACINTDCITEIGRIECDNWNRVLGMHIWIPSDLCYSEKAMMLASVFWAMTYDGFGIDTDSIEVFEDDLKFDELPLDVNLISKMDKVEDALNYRSWAKSIIAAKMLVSDNCI